MARLWAMTVDFENVAVGDTLPVLIKWETEDTILRYNSLHVEVGDDDEFPETLPQKTVESYIIELYEERGSRRNGWMPGAARSMWSTCCP